jgi:hypothetical protein
MSCAAVGGIDSWDDSVCLHISHLCCARFLSVFNRFSETPDTALSASGSGGASLYFLGQVSAEPPLRV